MQKPENKSNAQFLLRPAKVDDEKTPSPMQKVMSPLVEKRKCPPKEVEIKNRQERNFYRS